MNKFISEIYKDLKDGEKKSATKLFLGLFSAWIDSIEALPENRHLKSEKIKPV